MDNNNDNLICIKDYLDGLYPNHYGLNDKKIEEAHDRFLKDCENYPYVIRVSTKWWDPEGCTSDLAETNIEYAGDYKSLMNCFIDIKNNAINDKEYQSISYERNRCFEIYYPHAISKSFFTFSLNPLFKVKDSYNNILCNFHNKYADGFDDIKSNLSLQDEIVFSCLDEMGFDRDSALSDDIFSDIYNYVFGFEDSEDDLNDILNFLNQKKLDNLANINNNIKQL